MAGRNHYDANEMEERTCAKCGKVFLPAVYHRFREKHKGLWYCCWTCYNHRGEKEETEEVKPKKVDIRCTNCQDYAFCDFDKIIFHHRSGTPCENFKERK